jgi:hypothetical protein
MEFNMNDYNERLNAALEYYAKRFTVEDLKDYFIQNLFTEYTEYYSQEEGEDFINEIYGE